MPWDRGGGIRAAWMADTEGRACEMMSQDQFPRQPGETDGEAQQMRVLLVEDEVAVASAVRALLEMSGIVVAWAATGAEAKRLKHSMSPDVVLVDIGLPDTSGVSLIRWLVEDGSCGIIVVSGIADEADRVLSLELGADDYVLKPPNPRELVARIHAVHRRVSAGAPAHAATHPAGNGLAGSGPHVLVRPREGERLVQFGGVVVDLEAGTVHDAQHQPIDLTAAEFSLLERLILGQGQPVSRDELSQHVLRRPWRVDDRSIDQLVFQLRHKLTPEGDGHRVLQSVRGAGYLLRRGGSA